MVCVLAIAGGRASGPLTIVAPAAPGGGWDQTARALQMVFSSVEPAASVQVDNVAGAAGTIGLARFVTSERGNPDALLVTGLVMVSGITTNASPVSLADTTPIARLTGEAEVIVVPSTSRFQTFADLRAAFVASPGAVAWGGGSAGGTDDLLVRLLAESTGVPPNHVNYIAFAGGGAALAALLGGQVTAGVSGYGEFAGQIESGALRPLAVSTAQRMPGIDVPTLRELGIDLDLSNWRGIVAPPGLTEHERDALTSRVERVARSDAWRSLCARYGWEDMLLTGPAFRQFLIAEQARVNDVLRRLRTNRTTNSPSQWLTPTPATAPAAIGLGLLLLVAANLRAYRTNRAARSHTGGESTVPSPTATLDDRRALLLAAALAIYAIAMPVLGFVTAGTALFAATAALFGSRAWLRNAAFGVVATAVIYFAFTSGLGMTLPSDPLMRWASP
jgi:putative tricarboxylic transport membrane protein